jgi:anaerobic ribonucleoside-triphosphate reductase activating protein
MSAEGSLHVAQIVDDTEAEGPGRRFALWVQGCSIRCPGCCNPEMFVAGSEGSRSTPMNAVDLADRAIATPGIEGVSLLGGEPFEQADALALFAARVRAAGLTVMVYSGYTLAELRRMADEQGNAGVGALLAATDLLVDGRFEAAEPEARRRWIGSRNQQMHFLSDRCSPDDPRFSAPNTVEIRLRRGELQVNGWPALAREIAPRRARNDGPR